MSILNENFVVQLTVQQLKEIVSEAVETTLATNALPQYESTVTNRGLRICGLRELSKYLGCGVNTAQRLKNEEAIPYYQIGYRYYFWSNDVDAALCYFG